MTLSFWKDFRDVEWDEQSGAARLYHDPFVRCSRLSTSGRATTTAAATTVPLPATRTRTTTPTRTVATTTPTPMVSTSNGSRVYMGVSKALLTLIIGSTYHNDGQGGSTYTPPSGGKK